MITTSGNVGCPCINTTGTLSSLTNRHCQLPSGNDGIQLTLGGSCVPFSYGSSQCLQHDLLHDPSCPIDKTGDHIIPAHCFRPFCYVDARTCARESQERVYRSSYFPIDSEVDIFYSYSTCNSTADDWFEVKDDITGSNKALGGVSIRAVFPTYNVPAMYKRDPASGEVLSSPGDEYYDDSVLFEGAYPSFVNQIVEISNGDIRNITFSHHSRASSLIHPTSSFTASVQDIQDGLIDMAIGPFWITGQRLRMAAFTLPITNDKTFLVIPRPGTTDSYNDQMRKVLAPFTLELWGLVIGIIVAASLLSLWFTDRPREPGNRNVRMGLQGNRPKQRRRWAAYARLALDSFLQKGQYFCSAGVEQDTGSSLPNQILMFGFGFFILITVSAYVANLAAFLTLSTTDDVKTMDGAVAASMTVCAHPAIEAELKIAWPNANFYFHRDGNEFHGMMDDYDAGKCRAMAVGWEDTGFDTAFLKKLCHRNLVYTDSIINETPIAFPIRPGLASGFSYWIQQGRISHKISIKSAKEEFSHDVGCDVSFSGESLETNEYTKIEIKNMFLPLMFFASCAVLATLLQIIHHYYVKKGKQSLVGRRSTLSLVAEIDTTMPRTSFTARFNRKSSGSSSTGSKHDEEEEPYAETSSPRPVLYSTRSILKGCILSDGEDDEYAENDIRRKRSRIKFEGLPPDL